MELKYVVKKSDCSINQILKNEFNMSRRFILKLKQNKCIFINGICVSINFQIHPNDVLIIKENFIEDSSGIVPNSNIFLSILFEDDYLLIVDKPAGISVHPSILHYEDSLSNGVKFYYQQIGLNKKIRPVNRLDKDTSGIVIFAKNEYVQECLIRQMNTNVFEKKYIAVLDGIVKKDFGSICAPIARKENSIIERCISEDGEISISHFKVLDKFTNMSVVEYSLETGRTHQLRVHSNFIGHPIVGDSLYGKSCKLINRQALHAYYVSFVHPISKQQLVIKSNLPDDIKNLINGIRF